MRVGDSGTSLKSDLWQSVLFKHDRMFKHNIMRVNYTAYDVRRCEDVIHTGSAKPANIMVLQPNTASLPCDNHPFWYAQVLGIYHVNVIYIGEGNMDYSPERIEFLWVWWYELIDDCRSGQQLDRVRFPPLALEDSFGFLDPGDVLRACHIIPGLRGGKVHQDGIGLSHCARDCDDWTFYLVNRYSP
jgi:hypothetical protein